jgi:hypothetical protein
LKDPNDQPKKFREIGPLLFRDVNGQDRVGFKRDASGNFVEAIDFPFMVFQMAPWYENSVFQLPLILCSLVLLALTLILWPVMWIVRRHYGKRLELTPQQGRIRLLVRLACVFYAIFFAGFLVFFTIAEKDIGMLSPHGNPWLRLIQIFGWLGILGTLMAIYNAWQTWRAPQQWWGTRIGNTIIALACLGVIWFAFTWNLFQWSLKY